MDWKTAGIVTVLIIFGFLFLTMSMQGPYALSANAGAIIEIIVAVTIIVVVLYAVNYFFFTHKAMDYPATVKRELDKACTINRNVFVDTLEVAGDRDYQGHVLGNVNGTMRLFYKVTNDAKWLKQRMQEFGEEEKVDVDGKVIKSPLPNDLFEVQDTVFRVKEGGIMNLLKPAYLVRGIGDAYEYLKDKNGNFAKNEDGTQKRRHRPDMIQHTALTGHVKLICSSITYIGEYWYPNTSRSSLIPMQTQMADVDVKFGFVMASLLGDVVDKATDINSAHRFMLDQKDLIQPAKPSPSPQG